MSEGEISTLEKLYGETALMHWTDLQRFFAQGKVLYVREELDLVQTAVWFAQDDTEKLKPYLDSQTISHPSNPLARSWYEQNIELWTVVVAPYVLVQPQEN